MKINTVEIKLSAQTIHLFSCRISVLDPYGQQCENHEVKLDATTSKVSCMLKSSEFDGKQIKITVHGTTPDGSNKNYALHVAIFVGGQLKNEKLITGRNGSVEAAKFSYPFNV
jgi:hypothetical protein